MELEKFKLLNIEDNAPIKEIAVPVILNLNHIVSIKPINIPIKGTVLPGYWIRLSNGKKYKALEIPNKIKKLLEEDISHDSGPKQRKEYHEQKTILS
jgi:hypothetical protein